MVCWFSNLKKAENFIEKNAEQIYDNDNEYVVIEELKEKANPCQAKIIQWYRISLDCPECDYSEELVDEYCDTCDEHKIYYYMKVEPPEFAEHIVGWCG